MCLAIPARIVAFRDPERFLADVEVAGVRRAVNVALVSTGAQPAEVDDWVLVHVGFAIARIDEAEAAATLRLLRALGDAYEQEIEQLKQSFPDP